MENDYQREKANTSVDKENVGKDSDDIRSGDPLSDYRSGMGQNRVPNVESASQLSTCQVLGKFDPVWTTEYYENKVKSDGINLGSPSESSSDKTRESIWNPDIRRGPAEIPRIECNIVKEKENLEPMTAKEVEESAKKIADIILKRDDFGNHFKREQITAEFQNAVSKSSMNWLVHQVNAELKKANSPFQLSAELGKEVETPFGKYVTQHPWERRDPGLFKGKEEQILSGDKIRDVMRWPEPEKVWVPEKTEIVKPFTVNLKNTASGETEDRIQSSVKRTIYGVAKEPLSTYRLIDLIGNKYDDRKFAIPDYIKMKR